jgi:hypothetical protein
MTERRFNGIPITKEQDASEIFKDGLSLSRYMSNGILKNEQFIQDHTVKLDTR